MKSSIRQSRTSSSSSSSSSCSLSPKGRVRKSSEERKEKLKVEATLRRLLGSQEDSSQLELVLSAIQYIRQLQQQLSDDQENRLPAGFEQLFEKVVKA